MEFISIILGRVDKMKNKNSCYTYFRIVVNFEPDEITEILLNLHTGILDCVMLVFLFLKMKKDYWID